MRVFVWPADYNAGGHYRLQFPAEALAAQGADVIVDRVGTTVFWDREWHGDHPPLDAQVVDAVRPDCDVVVMQRPGRAHWTHLIERLQAQGVRVVVDVDDDLTAIPLANKAHASYLPANSPWHSRDWVMRACELADLVTVTTPALAKVYGAHGRVRVIPNYVPERYLKVTPQPHDGRIVGWAGMVDTHPHDLEMTSGAVHRALMAVPGSKLGVVGTGEGVAQRLQAKVDLVTGLVPFDQYPLAVAGLDVGIVPLHPSRFNAAKSALKMSEMAALGVAPIGSPTPDNQRLHALGVGILASSPAQWRKWLTRLLSNDELRADVAGRSREIMASQTYEARCGEWADAWSSVLDREMAIA